MAQQQIRIKSQIDDAIQGVLSHGKYIKGKEVGELERAIETYIGGNVNAIACANGTDALQIALMALDLKPGDEVITTAFTFISTAEVISLLGLVPVFVDIDPLTYNMDSKSFEEAITEKTKAVMPVSLYGQCADMDSINSIAEKNNIVVIEDAAQSFGAKCKGKVSGSLSSLATTSFFPSKPLGCYGDGGMIFSTDEKLTKRLRQIANHGQLSRYNHTDIGVNSRLDSLQAAILLVKLSIFDEEIKLKNKAADYYSKNLKGVVKVPYCTEDYTSVFAQYTIEVDNRDSFRNYLKAHGVPTAVHYPIPLHHQPIYKGKKNHRTVSKLLVSEKAAQRVVSLPMHPYLKTKTQDYIIETIKKGLNQ